MKDPIPALPNVAPISTALTLNLQAHMASAIAALLATKEPRARAMALSMLDDLEAHRIIHPASEMDPVRDVLRQRRKEQAEAANRRAMEQMQVEGPKLWEEFHRFFLRLRSKGLAETEVLQWLARFQARLPCGRCRSHFREIMSRMPYLHSPPYRDPFDWSVDIHNAVNAICDPPKPQMTYEAAQERWMGRAEAARLRWEIPVAESPNGEGGESQE